MILQDHLASGQANIGTPLRSRLDSQDSRLASVFAGLKHEVNITPSKEVSPAFMSPNTRCKLA